MEQLKERGEKIIPQRLFGEAVPASAHPEEILFYRRSFDALPFGVAIIGSCYRKIYGNPALSQLDPSADRAITEALTSPSCAAGKERFSLITAARCRILTNPDIQVSTGGREYAVYVFPIAGSDEKTYARIDIHNTSLQAENKQLKEANDGLRNRLSHLLTAGRMSIHDLRTPLSVISGYVQTLLHYPTDQSGIACKLNKILHATGEMDLGLSDSLRSLSVWREPNPEAVPAKSLLQTVLLVNRNLIENRRINLITGLPDETSIINTDPKKLSLVLNTLILNAFHAMERSDNKTLAIFCEIEDVNLTIYVEDNGTGMPDETKAKCFDESYTTKESTGLGLFLAKQVIEKDLGGRIWVDWSKLGKGSRFAVSVPLL